MFLLVIDTSGKNGSVALARAGDDLVAELQVIESIALVGGTFSALLVPQIAALLEKHKLAKTNIDAFIVVSGPGSFTGLRVGLAAIKALGEILGKPIVPVSLLEVIASASPARGRVLAVLDAGRGECYVGEYEAGEGAVRVLQEKLWANDDLADKARGIAVSTTATRLADLVRPTAKSVFVIGTISAEMIGELGLKKLRGGAMVSPEHLEANYIRRDTEIFSKPASS